MASGEEIRVTIGSPISSDRRTAKGPAALETKWSRSQKKASAAKLTDAAIESTSVAVTGDSPTLASSRNSRT